ncbi:hypothetical protein OG292_22460 [Streptomyces sp. NBC_01511]|uniref:hypothetical protein n=1 Tax=Streptomyces sp. NBC_01511 TaxID=2903889 RepID=UPI00386D0E2C
MAPKRKDVEEPEPSRAAGGCVLLVLIAGAVAGVFAASTAAGVLGLWFVGTVALWRTVRRRVSDMPATPPPLPPEGADNVPAGGNERIERVEYDPSGVRCTIHVVRAEVNEP